MSMCSTVQPVSSCPQSRLAAASLGAVLISLIVPYRAGPGWSGPCRTGWGAAVAISLPPARGLACRSAGRREIAGVALVIVAVIVTFTGDSNLAR